MDFRKIELIFLGVFVVLNIFLFSAIRQNAQAQTKESRGQTDVFAEMKTDRIKMAQLSNAEQKGSYVSGKRLDNVDYVKGQLIRQKVTMPENKIVGKLDKPITDKSDKMLLALEKFKDNPKNIFHGKEYRYSKTLSGKSQIVFLQVVNDKVIDETAQLVFFLNDDQTVDSYEQKYITKIEPLRDQQALITAKQAVINLYRNSEIPEKSTIRKPTLSYTRLLEMKQSDVYIPAWYVEIETDGDIQIKKVNAFSGAIMKNKISTSEVTDK